MAVTITSNRKNTSAVVHISSANASLVIAGNNSVSNIAKEDEVITGASIAQIMWGVDPATDGNIVVSRGGVVVAVVDSTGVKDYAGSGMALNVNPTANLDVVFNCSANAYIMIELQKQGQFTSEYFQS